MLTFIYECACSSMVEHLTFNEDCGGSIPLKRAIIISAITIALFQIRINNMCIVAHIVYPFKTRTMCNAILNHIPLGNTGSPFQWEEVSRYEFPSTEIILAPKQYDELHMMYIISKYFEIL